MTQSLSSIVRADASHSHFVRLVRLLDNELAAIDGEEHGFYAQFNKLDLLKNTVIGYLGQSPVACGAFKESGGGIAEIKRMYVVQELRGKGIAGQVLQALEQWAREYGFHTCQLETGKRQPDAIALYSKHGYRPIPNYGQYRGIENSICLEKLL